jgi:hypothetical protein
MRGGVDRWAEFVGVSQERLPPIAAAKRLPENAPHTEASAYMGENRALNLNLGGNSSEACTLTCLHIDRQVYPSSKLSSQTFAVVERDLAWDFSCSCFSLSAPYVPDTMKRF